MQSGVKYITIETPEGKSMLVTLTINEKELFVGTSHNPNEFHISMEDGDKQVLNILDEPAQ